MSSFSFFLCNIRFKFLNDILDSAELDVTENDLPPSVPFRIEGLPTLQFKLAGAREWVEYSGDRTLDSLIAFVNENSKNDLTRPENTGNSTIEEQVVFGAAD